MEPSAAGDPCAKITLINYRLSRLWPTHSERKIVATQKPGTVFISPLMTVNKVLANEKIPGPLWPNTYSKCQQICTLFVTYFVVVILFVPVDKSATFNHILQCYFTDTYIIVCLSLCQGRKPNVYLQSRQLPKYDKAIRVLNSWYVLYVENRDWYY